ncbi:MAG: GNAT family N-acetyltransferase [Pseudomonadota bacterium]
MRQIIRTERLVLRPPNMDELEDMFASANNVEIAKWLARMPWPLQIEETRRFVEANQDGEKDMRSVYLDGRPIGVVNVDGSFGLWLAQDCWGQGFATEASCAIIDEVFLTRDIDALPTGYFVGNKASERLLKKLGFESTDITMIETVSFGVKQSNNMVLTRTNWEKLR